MASNSQQNPRNPSSPPQSIPLQDLARPPDSTEIGNEERGHSRGRSILSGGSRPGSGNIYDARYDRLDDTSPSPVDRHILPTRSGPGLQAAFDDGHGGIESPIENLAGFAAAMTGFGGLEMGGGEPYPTRTARPISSDSMAFDPRTPYSRDYHDSSDSYFHSMESDTIPLTDPQYLQPVAGAAAISTPRQSQERHSFQSVNFNTPDSRNRVSRLGDDLPGSEAQSGRSRGISFGESLSPDNRRRSKSPSAAAVSSLNRAGSMMRAMSQRVVNISNEPEPVDYTFRRPSINDDVEDYPPIDVMEQETAFHPDVTPTPEKGPIQYQGPPIDPWPINNPFRGKTLGVFTAQSPIRIQLSNILTHPVTEPAILLLIILQAVLLAVESSPNVFLPGNERPTGWGTTKTDYAILALFVIYTLEISVRIIVSGFFFNPAEYSKIGHKRDLKAAIVHKYQTFFGPQRRPSIRKSRQAARETPSPSIVRSLTSIQQSMAAAKTTADKQRLQLAKRAFLRHSLNRIDIIAVTSYWVGFALSITHMESGSHLYVFRMLSCLRILRLLALTSGTSIILRSLKKAAPLLVNVSFLIGFFWLLFAIIGVQAFKSSFDRQCLWVDPFGGNNYTDASILCGGYLDNITGEAKPWIYNDNSLGASAAKGYLCPRGSFCMQQEPLYNGTVSFDNIIQSLELVFVIMSANTFTDLMYFTTNSDYLASALFFAAGIVIMMLWLTNLLIAVITSSFQIIREESDKNSAFAAHRESAIPPAESERRKRPILKQWFEKTKWLWIVIIVFGLLSQSLRSASMEDTRATFIMFSEVVVTFLLLIEIILRFIVDWRHFHKKPQNLVDAFLALVTTIILLPPIQNSGQAYAWLSVFQILRAYRVVWAVPITRELIAKVLGNATGIGNLVLFVFLITFLVAILAAQLFRGEIPAQDDEGNTIEVSFFTIYNSFLGMYQILSSENWTTILYNVTSYTTQHNTAWAGATFLIGWFILSYFILVNMFIAVIQENFDVSEDEKRLQQVKAFLQRKEGPSASSNLALSTIFRFGRNKTAKDPFDYGQAAMEMLLKDTVVRDFLDEDMDPLGENAQILDNVLSTPDLKSGKKRGFFSRIYNKFRTEIIHREPNPFYQSIEFSGAKATLDARTMAREAVSAAAQRKKAQRDFLARHPTYNTSLFIFGPGNFIRRICQKIVGPGRGSERFEGVEPNKTVWYTFSAFIYATIVTMVVLACVTTPLYQKEYFAKHDFSILNWVVWTDMAFAIIFTIESIIKIIADGAFFTPNAYFRSAWGIIDGLVLATLWVNIITSFMNDGAVSRAVGAFKALRALRLLNVSDSARETFHSVIFVGGLRVISAAFVSLSLLIPFAIYGLNLFNGQMVQCNDSGSGIINLSDCVGEYNSTPYSSDWNIIAPRVAANPYYDFDNFGDSLFILFQIVSQEGWVDVMWSAESITGRGFQPLDYNSQGNSVFFVIFNLMATVFVLTLFISVFMRTYTEQTGVAFLTAEQRSWLELRKLLKQVNPSKRPSNKSIPTWRMWCYKRAVRKQGKWHKAVTLVLVLHLVVLMLEFYPEPKWWERARIFIFLVFTLFYIVNIAVRISGLTWARFRRSSWDVFSLLAVFGTFVSIILVITDLNSVAYNRLNKLFLVSIALLLIPRNNSLDQLFKTAAASLTSIANLLATWFILFLMFAIAMTQTFGLTRFGSQETNNLNFRTVPKALIVLFRMSVGEGWNSIMEDFATIEPPFCVDAASFYDSDCGSASWARALFIAWNILSMYIFVSLFVSLIYESFSYVYQLSNGLPIVTREEIRRFKQAWSLFDPKGQGYISKEQFPRLLGELSGVFAMRIYDEEDSVRRILEDVQIQQVGSRAASVATVSQAAGIDLQALNRRVAQINSKKVKARRYRYNIFYEEVMVSADPDRGISFTSVLMILAHYNVISDSKSLKLDEFLRRRARLQRVEEEARRRVVVGFFDTIYWSRQFRRHTDRHKSSRMTDIPQFEVPEIIIDDDNGESSRPMEPPVSPMVTPSAMYEEPHHHNPFHDGFRMDGNPSYEPYRPRRGTDASQPGSDGLRSRVSSPSRSPRLSPHHVASNSAYSFDLQEPGSGPNSRRGSAVNAETVLEVFQDSAWGESLRRSFTTRRSRDGSS